MGGINPRFKHGPITYKANSAVRGGDVVQARTDGKIERCSAGSLKVLGVALTDAAPAVNAQSTGADGFPVTVVPTITEETAVEDNAWLPGVTFAAPTAFGQKVKAGASGAVTPWVDGTDSPALIIGYCATAAGVTAGGKGLLRINL